MNTNPTSVGARVRETRKSRGISAAKLAEMAHVAPNTVSSIENGKAVRPGSMKAVLDVLEIEGATSPPSAYPDDVDLVMVFVGEFLMARPAEQRGQIERDLTRFLIERYASYERTISDGSG